MTTTYNNLRVRRGYFANATCTRARTRTREMSSGLKITPHNPANPANTSRQVYARSQISCEVERRSDIGRGGRGDE
jgi:hypothetical protein